MFAKLGDYLTQNNIQRPTRFLTPSGESFVVLPAREYTLLTGIDIDTLPIADPFDSVPDVPEEEITPPPALLRNAKRAGSLPLEKGEEEGFSSLAFIPLEDEISVDRLPL